MFRERKEPVEEAGCVARPVVLSHYKVSVFSGSKCHWEGEVENSRKGRRPGRRGRKHPFQADKAVCVLKGLTCRLFSGIVTAQDVTALYPGAGRGRKWEGLCSQLRPTWVHSDPR